MKVLQPASVAGLALRNRFFRSATHDGMADQTGMATDRGIALFEGLAEGGVGLIITGFAFVSPDGQAVPAQYGIHCDEMIPGLRRLVAAAHKHGAKIAAQIVHSGCASGYLARSGRVALAPSEVAGRQPHRAMTDEEVEGVISAFVAAGVRAREAGFDAVQLHGAHGYLMSQFFSPLTNHREDRWGGSPENRRRFHVETVRRVRSAVGPDFPLMMKFGVMDDDEGGAPLEEGLAALQAMIEAGLDGVEISGGIGSGKRSSVRVIGDDVTEITWYRERAALVKRQVGIPVAVVGGVRCVETAEAIVASGDADFVSLARPLLREPDLIRRWEQGDPRRAACRSCGKCSTLVGRGEPVHCVDALQGHAQTS